MGNIIAYAALSFWPLISLYWLKAKNTQVAILFSIIGGVLCLPANMSIDLPLLPPLNQHTLPSLSIFIFLFFLQRKNFVLLKSLGTTRYLAIIFILSPFITVSLNNDYIAAGAYYLRGLVFYDGFSLALGHFISLLAFFLGRYFFREYKEQALIFKFLVISCLVYSLLIFYEVRMSPQLHTMLYGYFPSSFIQQYRAGGFRPVVFIGHGLGVAFFVSLTVLCAFTLFKLKEKIFNISLGWIFCYLLFILILCKSLAAFIYALAIVSLLHFFKIKRQLYAGVLIALLTFSYPMMSLFDFIPHKAVVSMVAENVGMERAQSLEFRFSNEERLIEHTREKVFFGWGSWGRNLLYDKETGQNTAVVDGSWIITFSQFGLAGFLSKFGIILISVLIAYKASKKLIKKEEKILLSSHILLVSIIMFDQLLNASLVPWLWLIIGALYGRSEFILIDNKNNVKEV